MVLNWGQFCPQSIWQCQEIHLIVTIRVFATRDLEILQCIGNPPPSTNRVIYSKMAVMLWSSKPNLDNDLSNIVSKEKKHIFIFLILGNFFRERASILMDIIRLWKRITKWSLRNFSQEKFWPQLWFPSANFTLFMNTFPFS